MREVELKSAVDDLPLRRARLLAAGAVLDFAGAMVDRRYDTPSRALEGADEVLRLRVYHAAEGGAARASIDWKGAVAIESGYKIREELSTGADDGDAMAVILTKLGYVVTRAIDRDIEVYHIDGAVVRFEIYPRMDILVEVEGDPERIEAAIVTLGLPRAGFTSEPLSVFVARFEQRTGEKAVVGKEGGIVGGGRTG